MFASLASMTITTFLVILLARTAWHKVDSFLETLGFAQGYDIVPERAVPAIIRALTVVEGGAILALLIPVTRSFGGLVAAGLFAGYGVLMAWALAKAKTRIDCGCGGLPQIVSGFTLARNGILAALALTVALVPVTTVPPAGAVLAIAAALVFSASYAVIEKLASHQQFIRFGGR